MICSDGCLNNSTKRLCPTHSQPRFSRLCANFTWTLNTIYSTGGLPYWEIQRYVFIHVCKMGSVASLKICTPMFKIVAPFLYMILHFSNFLQIWGFKLEVWVSKDVRLHALADRAVLKQDGATLRSARISQKFLTSATIDALLWPAKSPYINTVQNIWSVILRWYESTTEKRSWASRSVHNEGQTSARTWWRHPVKTFSALLAICAGNSPVNSPHKGQWRGALMFFFICAWVNGWVNNRMAGDLRRHRAHFDVIVMIRPLVDSAPRRFRTIVKARGRHLDYY